MPSTGFVQSSTAPRSRSTHEPASHASAWMSPPPERTGAGVVRQPPAPTSSSAMRMQVSGRLIIGANPLAGGGNAIIERFQSQRSVWSVGGEAGGLLCRRCSPTKPRAAAANSGRSVGTETARAAAARTGPTIALPPRPLRQVRRALGLTIAAITKPTSSQPTRRSPTLARVQSIGNENQFHSDMSAVMPTKSPSMVTNATRPT